MDGTSPPIVNSQKTDSNDRTKMITLITAIIAVMIVAIAIVVTLRKGSVPPATPAVNSVIAARALISVPNPPSGLSPEEIKARQALLIH